MFDKGSEFYVPEEQVELYQDAFNVDSLQETLDYLRVNKLIHMENSQLNASIDLIQKFTSSLLVSFRPKLQLIGTTCGFYWAELFQSLVNITNSCDRAGTIANELPIVEQIPVSRSPFKAIVIVDNMFVFSITCRCCIVWIIQFTRCVYGATQRQKNFALNGT